MSSSEDVALLSELHVVPNPISGGDVVTVSFVAQSETVVGIVVVNALGESIVTDNER